MKQCHLCKFGAEYEILCPNNTWQPVCEHHALLAVIAGYQSRKMISLSWPELQEDQNERLFKA